MKKIHIVACISFALSSGCQYYNYGVQKDDPQIQYPDPYKESATEKYQFHSTLLDTPNIQITHLYSRHYDRSIVDSTIQINTSLWHTNTIIKAVTLEHRDTQGNLIAAQSTERDTLPISQEPKTPVYFINTYKKSDLPKDVIECISIEIQIDGVTKILKFEFPLKYKRCYSFWDVMMSV